MIRGVMLYIILTTKGAFGPADGLSFGILPAALPDF